jgi:putative PIN family toxin of toxin-antitoxin system
MLRVVLDTNVLVSHLFGGTPRQVVSLWSGGLVVLCVSPGILAEYLSVLGRFDAVTGKASELLGLLEEGGNLYLVEPQERLTAVPADPSDDMFLECAVAAQADVIVSGDQHLLELKSFRGIPIVGPAEFLAAFGK